jgi:hypothetical protein
MNEENDYLKSVLSEAMYCEQLSEDNIISVNDAHKEELARVRRLISFYLRTIEENLTSSDIQNIPWGEKESVITVLYKLIPILIRVIPIERNIHNLENGQAEAVEDGGEEILSPHEIETLSQYVMRQNNADKGT